MLRLKDLIGIISIYSIVVDYNTNEIGDLDYCVNENIKYSDSEVDWISSKDDDTYIRIK